MAINNQNDSNDAGILEAIMKKEGVYDKVFGPELLNQLVYDIPIDYAIHTIGNVYGYTDSESVFRRKIDRTEFKAISRIIFKFQEISQNDNSK